MKLFKIRNTKFQYLKFWLKSFILLGVLLSLYLIFIWYFSFFGLPIPASIYHPLCLLSFLTHPGLYDWSSKPLSYQHSDLPNIYQNSKIGSMTKSDISTSRKLSIAYTKHTFIETGTLQIHGFQLLLCYYHQKPFNLIISHHFYPNFPIFNQTSYSTTDLHPQEFVSKTTWITATTKLKLSNTITGNLTLFYLKTCYFQLFHVFYSCLNDK